MVKKITSIYSVAFFLWILVAFHLVVFFADFYHKYNGLDKVAHFFGGFWLALFFCYWAQRKKWAEPRFFTVLAWVALTAVFWEFHEFLTDLFIKVPILKMQTSAVETVGDLFFGLLGASIFLVWRRLLSLMEAKN